MVSIEVVGPDTGVSHAPRANLSWRIGWAACSIDKLGRPRRTALTSAGRPAPDGQPVTVTWTMACFWPSYEVPFADISREVR